MENCFLCSTLTPLFIDARKEVSNCSGRLLAELFSIINGSKLEDLDYFCYVCMEKICEYDEYSTKAEQIQTELQMILAGKDEATEEELTNVVVIEEYLDEMDVFQSDYDQQLKSEEPEERQPKERKAKKAKKITEKLPKKKKGPYRRPKFAAMLSCPEPGCTRRFFERKLYNSHVQYHAKERSFVCECGKDFKTKACLKSHIRHVHKDFYVICDHCGRNFLSKNGLTNHLRSVHLKLKEFVCSTCGRAFSNPSSLKSHHYTHDPEASKTVVCEICSARFFNKSKLSRHMKTHTTEREFQCQLCSRMFNHRYNVTAHLKAVHRIGADLLKANPVSVNICQLCGKVFDKKKALQVHLRTVHEAIPFTESIMSDLDA